MAVDPNLPGDCRKNQVRMIENIQVDVERIAAKAKRANLTLATVESCTAGALACALAEPAGAGETFQGGIVVYSWKAPSRKSARRQCLRRSGLQSASQTEAARGGITGTHTFRSHWSTPIGVPG